MWLLALEYTMFDVTAYSVERVSGFALTRWACLMHSVGVATGMGTYLAYLRRTCISKAYHGIRQNSFVQEKYQG